MKRLAFIATGMAIAIVTARGGHELPVYPSYYPHEIEMRTVAPEQAADLLAENKIQAYVGGVPRFSGAVPDFVRPVESLGSFVVVRLNPQSASATQSACAVAAAVVRALIPDLAGRAGEFHFHPYPVTPLHGDYLFHADRAAVATARFSAPPGDAAALTGVKVRAGDTAARSFAPPEWLSQGADFDAEVVLVDAAGLLASATTAMNGGPPWVRTGWFHAFELLAGSVDDPGEKQRVEDDVRRLMAGDFTDLVERINLEREVVAGLADGCRTTVAGYTLKREYVSVEYSAGIENLGFDAIAGLNSPTFLRTVKLKDFPWNGWLVLGVDAPPSAAWNPIAGLNDPFGRLMWSAVGDAALIPSPYDAGWMLNRFSDVQSSRGP